MGDDSPNSAEGTAARLRPLLVYDGDCGFCGYWARYWNRLTGDAVEYRTYQDVGAQYPDVSVAEFQRAVQYIARDGTRARAAEASFLTLSHAPGQRFWIALYRALPAFAFVSEVIYAFVAAHRPGFHIVSKVLWGQDFNPPRYDVVSFWFFRLLGLIYLSAFVSFAVQAPGLIGSKGILPLGDFIANVTGQTGAERYFEIPMLFWLNASDGMIAAVCWTGAALSLALMFNVLPRLSLFLLYLLYLSLLYAGQEFMNYQWDIFLLETGFLALVMSIWTLPGLWLLRWLLFRFMFMSGMVKLLSGDPNWWNLTALSYHFFTQPLPTPVAWYAAHLSSRLLQFATGSMFVIELVLPFLIFSPRRLRFVAGFGILLLQFLILITGNYNWFNLQAMLLCLLLFDDAALQKLLPTRLTSLHRHIDPPREPVRMVIWVLALLLVFCSLVEMNERFGGSPLALAEEISSLVGPFRIVSPYGLFAVMTTSRNEIVIQGSNDGVNWLDYEFRYKPGDLNRAPPWNIPHQPRLDWQIWFASFEDPRRLPWFSNFLYRLLGNEPAVTTLLAKNPFPDRPPIFLRALAYAYTFSSEAEKAKGIWWHRRLLGSYFPVVRLKAN